MEIDPLAAIIAFFLSQPSLTARADRRIAPKHEFGIDAAAGGWPAPSQAIQLQLVDGAEPDLNVAQQNVRMVCRCYGASQAEAQQLWRAVLGVLRAIETRFTVATPAGRALVYWLLPDGSPRADVEPDVNVDFIEFALRAAVAERAV